MAPIISLKCSSYYVGKTLLLGTVCVTSMKNLSYIILRVMGNRGSLLLSPLVGRQHSQSSVSCSRTLQQRRTESVAWKVPTTDKNDPHPQQWSQVAHMLVRDAAARQ